MLDNNWFDTISSISDINHPTKEDYEKLNKYLRTPRKYLDPIYRVLGISPPTDQASLDFMINNDNYLGKRTGQSLMLLGKNGEMPNKHIDKGSNNTQCVYLYASYNGNYTHVIDKNLNALRKNGYKGDVIILKGGFPNTENGGLLHCHLPYSFKYAAIEECRLLGYRYFLWIDIANIAQKNIDYIFKEIEQSGTYIFGGNKLGSHFKIENGKMFAIPDKELIGSPEAYESMGLDLETASNIPYQPGSVQGYDLHSELCKAFLKLMKQYIDNITPWICVAADCCVHSVALYQIPYEIRFHPCCCSYNIDDNTTFLVEQH
jgi:hypothetical protein